MAKRKKPEESHPPELLRGVLWAFRGKPFADRAAVDQPEAPITLRGVCASSDRFARRAAFSRWFAALVQDSTHPEWRLLKDTVRQLHHLPALWFDAIRDLAANPVAVAMTGLYVDSADFGAFFTGLECLPFTDVPDVCVARHIVEEADRPNGGLCVDIWHHVRGLNDLAAIAGLPGESITGIQMNDGPLVAADPTLDYKTDCLMNRVAPGDGEFDVAGFLAALAATGTTAPMSYEVCNLRGWDDPDAHVRRIGEVARKLGV